MQLIYSPTSPFARKARMVIIEKQLEDRVTLTTASSLASDALDIIRNPLGKVPCLIRDDETALFDSPVICAYLDHIDAAPTLLPLSGEARWQIERAQALADGLMDAAFALVTESRRDDAEQSEFWTGRWRAAITRSLAEMKATCPSADSEVDLGQISYACALGYLDLRHPDTAWRDLHPSLAQWLVTFSARDSFQMTAPPGDGKS